MSTFSFSFGGFFVFDAANGEANEPEEEFRIELAASRRCESLLNTCKQSSGDTVYQEEREGEILAALF